MWSHIEIVCECLLIALPYVANITNWMNRSDGLCFHHIACFPFKVIYKLFSSQSCDKQVIQVMTDDIGSGTVSAINTLFTPLKPISYLAILRG